MEKIRKVTRKEMISIIMEIEKNSPHLLQKTISVKMKTLFNTLQKTKETKDINPYFKQIFKVSNRTYRILTNYEQRVKNNLVKENKDSDTFQVEAPKGKKHITKAILTDSATETKNYFNLEVFVNVKGSKYYEFEGKEIEKSKFEKWVSNSYSSNDKQNLEKEVLPLTPNFDNILEISMLGTKYIMLD
jgi:hypothetical protein